MYNPEKQTARRIELLPLDGLVLAGNIREHVDQESIREMEESLEGGQVEPILVRPGADGKYQVISGEKA